MHYFPDAYIFGVSAQGDEYIEDEEVQSKLLEKTENGTRAFIVDKDGNVLDVDKLTKYYSTAVPGTTNKAANIEVAYLNEEKGEV